MFYSVMPLFLLSLGASKTSIITPLYALAKILAHIFWGLGLGIERHPELGEVAFHRGDNGLFKALFLIVPENHLDRQRILVYFTNSEAEHDIIEKISGLFLRNKRSMATIFYLYIVISIHYEILYIKKLIADLSICLCPPSDHIRPGGNSCELPLPGSKSRI